MARQYLLLCQRVRAVAAHVAGKRRAQQQKCSADLLAAAKSWMRPARCTVVPVWTFSFIHVVISATLGRAALGVTMSVAGRISTFVGELFGCQLPKRLQDLAQVHDHSPRKRQKTGNLGAPGPVMKLRSNRRLVCVQQVDVDADCGAVCVASDQYPYFTTGAGMEEVPDPSQSAFHALRLHRRCRVARARSCVRTSRPLGPWFVVTIAAP